MMHAAGRIDVQVGGAVVAAGLHRLPPGAILRDAIDIAGGFAAGTAEMRPSGIVTVRRTRGDREVDVFQFVVTDVPTRWQELPLQSGDLIVAQWDVAPAKA